VVRVFRLPVVREQVSKFGAKAEADLREFLSAKMDGSNLRRLDKPCGKDRKGLVVCQEQIDLCMRHYRFTPSDDPLLMYQEFPDFLWLVGVANHHDVFQGRERLWCYNWRHAIYWEECPHHLVALTTEFEKSGIR
jgi:hypothetical protein